MKMTNQEYAKYVKDQSPKSKLWLNMLNAFWIGGLICVVGQAFSNMYGHWGLDEKAAATMTSITMIFIGALLTGLKIYDNIAKIGGAGTIIPITGFANSIVASAMEYKSEGFILGMGAKMFAIAGPVLVYGISASVVLGVIYQLLGSK